MTITLCGFTLSNYYNKVKMVLLEKGLPFTEVRIGKADRDEAMLAASPLGKVPFIRTEHGTLCESGAIVEYLEALAPALERGVGPGELEGCAGACELAERGPDRTDENRRPGDLEVEARAVGPQHPRGRRVALDEGDRRRVAGEGLEADRAGAGVEIEEAGAVDPLAQHREGALAHGVRGGPHGRGAAGPVQPPRPPGAAGDPHGAGSTTRRTTWSRPPAGTIWRM